MLFFDLFFIFHTSFLSYLFQLGVCILPLLVFAACAPMAIIQIWFTSIILLLIVIEAV